jgi:thioesterase domain-containing protein
MKHLCPDHPFLVALPFGLEPETVPGSIEEVAQIYVTSLENQYPSQEYIVGGFSMGGLVALEVASILKSKGKSVKALFFIDTFHPEMLKKERDGYQIKKRVLFYLKRFFEENAQNKKAIIKYLIGRWISITMGLFKKDNKNPAILRLQELLGIRIDRNKLYAEYKNVCLSFKFRPKLYTGDVTLISAQNNKRHCIYQEFYQDQERSENIIKWRNNTSGKLYTYEVSGNHIDIMNEPVVTSIAQIINEHLLKD